MINIHCLVKALIILITSQKSMIIFLTIRNTKQSNVRSLPHTDHSRSSNTYKKMIRLVGDSSDISVFSVHESVFIFPSKHHLACTGKNLLCGSRFNQLTDYRNKPYLIFNFCAEIVSGCWWIPQQQQLHLRVPTDCVQLRKRQTWL